MPQLPEFFIKELQTFCANIFEHFRLGLFCNFSLEKLLFSHLKIGLLFAYIVQPLFHRSDRCIYWYFLVHMLFFYKPFLARILLIFKKSLRPRAVFLHLYGYSFCLPHVSKPSCCVCFIRPNFMPEKAKVMNE